MNRKLILTAVAVCLATAATPAFAGRNHGGSSGGYPSSSGGYPSSSGGSTKVPEPGTLALLGMGLMGLGIARRRRTKG